MLGSRGLEWRLLTVHLIPHLYEGRRILWHCNESHFLLRRTSFLHSKAARRSVLDGCTNGAYFSHVCQPYWRYQAHLERPA